MAGGSKGAASTHADPRLSLNHLRRDARTALELAVVALAAWPVIQRLATAAGLLEALSELPSESPPAVALLPKVLGLAEDALDQWRKWEKDHLEKKLPRG